MPTSRVLSWIARLLRFLLRSTVYAAVVVAALVCATALALRFYYFPRIDDYRPEIEGLLSRAVGQPVDIARTEPAWDGWNPRLVLSGVRMRDQAGTTLLELPTVDAVVSWRWALVGQLRLKALTIDEPALLVRRDADGRIHVAGAVIESGNEQRDSAFGKWVLQQRVVAVRNGTVTWVDERAHTPPLTLERVDFRLENGLGRHRFGLTGAPPAALSSPLDVRGDLRGDALSDQDGLDGRLYVRLDYADVAAWRKWLPIPVDVVGGTGAVRLWIDVDNNLIGSVTGALDLAEVRIRLAADRPPLALARLGGQIAVHPRNGNREVMLTDVAVTTPDGTLHGPGSGNFAVSEADGRLVGRGEIRMAAVDLAFAERALGSAPIPESWRETLQGLSPSGRAQDVDFRWQGEGAVAMARFTAKARFHDVSLAGQGPVPALAGASGSFDANEKGGQVQLTAQGGRLVLPRAFTDPLVFDRLSGHVGWQLQADELVVTLTDVAFANADAAGALSGQYRTTGKGRGYADLTGSLSRADPRRAYRYIPLIINDATRKWLRDSVVGGTPRDVKFRVKGDLADFPFENGKGEFQVALRAEDAELRYADDWPAIRAIRADLLFDRDTMKIVAQEGEVLGTRLGRVEATIASFAPEHPLLRIEGEATGATREFLRFIDSSPVAGWIDRFTEGMEATGDGRLALRLELPLGDLPRSHVAGEYAMQTNRVRVSSDVPVLDHVTGTVTFTERDVSAKDLAAEIFGGPAQLSLNNVEGRLRVAASGNVDLPLVMRSLDVPGHEFVSGRTDWRIAIDARTSATASWDLTMSLKGVAIDLPAPIGKPAEAVQPLRLERRALAKNRESLLATLGAPERRVGQLKLVRTLAADGSTLDSALVLLGNASGDVAGRGLTFRGDVAHLDADAWLARWERFAEQEGKSRAAETPIGRTGEKSAPTSGPRGQDNAPLRIAGLEIQGADLRAGSVLLGGRTLHEAGVKAIAGQTWRVDVDSREISGRVDWHRAATPDDRGKVTARLQKLDLGGDSEQPSVSTTAAERAAQREAHDPRKWPAIDLVADALWSKGRQLGRLELVGVPGGDDWRVERLRLANPDGDLDVEGWWRGSRPQHTEVGVQLTIRNTSAYLHRLGYPDAVKGAATVIRGQLSWPGGLRAFDYPELAGNFRIETEAGQFTKMDPGFGKLLGVLNLQMLPRRIAFDFRDVFSEGFAFDALSGSVRISNGVMTTSDLQFSGPAARVEIAGEANLVEETQKLTVRVYPSLSSSVAVGAAIGLANPLAGAAVLLGQKLLQDPVDRLFVTEYRVSGPWSDPQVAKVPLLERGNAAAVGGAAR